MKFFLYFFFLLLASIAAGAQATHIDVANTEISQLDSGWKFKAGDDAGWSKPGFDDHSWKTVSLSNYNSYLPEFSKTCIGWFRTVVVNDSPALSQSLALLISQFGASEIYINGNLISSFGKIVNGAISAAFNPHDKPILVTAKEDTLNIAIRYASHMPYNIALYNETTLLPLGVSIAEWAAGVDSYDSSIKKTRLLTAIFSLNFLFCLLFLFIYIAFRSERVHLYFSAFCFFFSCRTLWDLYMSGSHPDIAGFVFWGFLRNLSDMGSGMLILSFLSVALFNTLSTYRKLLIFDIVVLSNIQFLLFPGNPTNLVLTVLLRSLFTIECIRLAISAIKQKKYIIALMASSSAAINLSFFFDLYFRTEWLSKIVVLNGFAIFLLMSLYLAAKLARDKKNLADEFEKNKILAAENIKAEQEKQQILASQNETLDKQVKERTEELSKSLTELKETQSQLVQREKMASLGELIAGIAHEIQNPLNFVNNFSEVNKELIGEMHDEIQKGNFDGAKKIAKDIISNEEKISEHGKRADAIVKSMLQHSRASGGQKELTDINLLCDEYLRLSYHGMRAKDKGFNVIMNTDFDSQAGMINIIPQEIGRVLMNLYNNAFYAVNEKKKQDSKFEPIVCISTQKRENGVEIAIKDNGIGVAAKIREKIFQPFFSTKPTGQGTGLGLSLSYDIITKGHDGKIFMREKEEEETEFVIQLH